MKDVEQENFTFPPHKRMKDMTSGELREWAALLKARTDVLNEELTVLQQRVQARRPNRKKGQ